MKKFTVKDFLLYNEPSICCNTNMNLLVLDKFHHLSTKNKTFTIFLVQQYGEFALTLNINYQTNRFTTSNVSKLRDFFSSSRRNNDIVFLKQCTGKDCGSYVRSKPISLDLVNFTIGAIHLEWEHLKIILPDKMKDYIYLDSNFHTEESYLYFLNKKLKIPFLPIYKIKSKEVLLNKIKTYMVFS